MYLAFDNRGASQRDAICLDGALETATDSYTRKVLVLEFSGSRSRNGAQADRGRLLSLKLGELGELTTRPVQCSDRRRRGQ